MLLKEIHTMLSLIRCGKNVSQIIKDSIIDSDRRALFEAKPCWPYHHICIEIISAWTDSYLGTAHELLYKGQSRDSIKFNIIIFNIMLYNRVKLYLNLVYIENSACAHKQNSRYIAFVKRYSLQRRFLFLSCVLTSKIWFVDFCDYDWWTAVYSSHLTFTLLFC